MGFENFDDSKCGLEARSLFCIQPDEPWFSLVNELLDRSIEDAIYMSCSMATANSHGQLAHCTGMLDGLRGFKDELERLRVLANSGSDGVGSKNS